VLVQVTDNSISRVTGQYATAYDPSYTTGPILTDEAVYRDRRLGPKDLPRLEATLRGYGPRTFLILNQGQRRFARLFGTLPAGWEQRLERALYTSASFRPIYVRGPDSIFRFEP
jgi:hypothetical protein